MKIELNENEITCLRFALSLLWCQEYDDGDMGIQEKNRININSIIEKINGGENEKVGN